MIGRSPRKGAFTVLAAGLCLTLAGCKEDVYTGLAEREVNEMVAVLAAADITPSRKRDKDGAYALRVEAADVPAAITVLREAGYPRESFQSLGDVFGAEGVFGTPFEQHARYLHAMNEELSATVSAIDGIRFAKVLVTAPPKGRFDRDAPRAKASVTIHHESGRDIRAHLSSIKLIVAHALPNLRYDDVAVALFEAGGPVVAATMPRAEPSEFAGDTGRSDTTIAMAGAAPLFPKDGQAGLLAVALAACVAGLGLLRWHMRRGRS